MDTKKALETAIKSLHQKDTGFADSVLDALQRAEDSASRFSQHMLMQLDEAMRQTRAY